MPCRNGWDDDNVRSCNCNHINKNTKENYLNDLKNSIKKKQINYDVLYNKFCDYSFSKNKNIVGKSLKNYLLKISQDADLQYDRYNLITLVSFNIDNVFTRKKLKKLNRNYTSAICAILSEIEINDSMDLEDFLNTFNKVDSLEVVVEDFIRKFWVIHKTEDILRVTKELKKRFSKHEIELIKNNINNLEI